MNRIIRIVHLEDDENDAMLVKESINSEIADCTIKRVATKNEFIEAIKNEQCDLIISDFALPSFDGLQALKIACELAPNVPYIYVSGHIGEDRAIEALKNGATDYVLKDKPSKLVPAILRALKEVEEKEKRRILEEAIRESERFAKSTLDALLVPVAVLDDKGIILVTNKAWKRNLYPDASVPQGLKERENYIEKCFEDKNENSDASRFAKYILLIFSGESKTYAQEYSFHSSGQKKWFRSIAVKFEEAGPLRVVIVHVDITDSESASEKLKESEIRYRLLAENSSDMISTHDANLKILYVSPASSQLLGYKPDELSGKEMIEITHPDDRDKILRISASILEGGKIRSIVTRTRKKDGSYVWIEMTAKKITNNITGEAESIIAVSRDISERKNHELELERAKEKAEEMNRLKTNFLANMSHELRTPLIGILGFSELLKTELPNGEQLEMAETIYISGNRLLETLNLILDLSSIEGNMIRITYKLFNCVEKVKEIIRLFAKVAEKKNLYLKIDSDADALEINLDERMFTAILENLLNNAIKFTNSGGVTVKIIPVVKDEEKMVIIKVSDTGIGIPKESQSLIFEEFRQVSEGYGRGFEGSGLGLTITKKFVEKLNGNITLESEPGRGTTFTLSFPVNKITGRNSLQKESLPIQENGNQDNSPNENKTAEKNLLEVLLVDNDEATKSITKFFLKDLYTVETASNGLSAIQMAKAKKYSTILMDINLGHGMNGIEAVKEIRTLPGYQDISIIAFTAYAFARDKKEFLAAGCTHYISKPFTKAKLLEVMKEATVST